MKRKTLKEKFMVAWFRRTDSERCPEFLHLWHDDRKQYYDRCQKPNDGHGMHFIQHYNPNGTKSGTSAWGSGQHVSNVYGGVGLAVLFDFKEDHQIKQEIW